MPNTHGIVYTEIGGVVRRHHIIDSNLDADYKCRENCIEITRQGTTVDFLVNLFDLGTGKEVRVVGGVGDGVPQLDQATAMASIHEAKLIEFRALSR
ncbi:MAG: hypothetical protein A2289_13790 [Deltaproteobacteria bacterium RIFOXYA12_FULL_58_15]|nr:MAG: hypothetical protein A2289_13790 [Deltaproteobacteria bacterium RIFOXYA12_FULL_58_15]OGR07450.1 MAG: hypothetical protein A2341_26410 [Deltaproteobacteria bacterium RIFOXYB12_FULL_58_9]